MDEVFPVLAGIVVGLLLHPLRSRALRSILLVGASLGFGALASWLAGELAISVIYVLIDATQVAVAALLTAMAVIAWRRRQLRARS